MEKVWVRGVDRGVGVGVVMVVSSDSVSGMTNSATLEVVATSSFSGKVARSAMSCCWRSELRSATWFLS